MGGPKRVERGGDSREAGRGLRQGAGARQGETRLELSLADDAERGGGGPGAEPTTGTKILGAALKSRVFRAEWGRGYLPATPEKRTSGHPREKSEAFLQPRNAAFKLHRVWRTLTTAFDNVKKML
jgi:hypothetical protein